MTRLPASQKQYLKYMKKTARKKFVQMNYRARKKVVEEARRQTVTCLAREKRGKESGRRQGTTPDTSRKTAPVSGAVKKVGKGGVRAARSLEALVGARLDQMLSKEDTKKKKEDGTPDEKKAAIRTPQSVTRLIDGAQRSARVVQFQKSFLKNLQIDRFAQGSTAPKTNLVRTVQKAVNTAIKSVVNTVRLAAANPVILLFFGCAVFVLLVASYGMGTSQYLDSDSGSGVSAESPLSDAVEGYRRQVSAACQKYRVPDYVNLALAMMQQESGGTGNDPMQASEGPFNKKYPQKPGGITDPAYSIECGVQEMKSCLVAAKVTGPTNIKQISLALQGYNYGNGYIAWAIDRDGGYTKENARAFSELMKKKMGWKNYGDPDYVQHVLRYYSQPATVSSGTDAAAKKIINSLYQKAVKNGVGHVGDRFKVITAGARLIGKCGYSRDSAKNPRNGSDNPAYLDCSSFVAWSYNKAGFSPVPYTAYTGTFLQTKNFVTIDKKLQPGDIGLNNANASGGGTNHVGIYLGVYQGKELWLHCTSGRSDRVAGNNSGVMISPHPNFAIFKRYKVWN